MNIKVEKFLSELKPKYISMPQTLKFGKTILVMESEGKSFGRVYWYNDDIKTVYLDWLYVKPEDREKGLGTEMQEIREMIGRRLGAETSGLWVRNETWMLDWYKRRGYSFWKEYPEENATWLFKSINNNLKT